MDISSILSGSGYTSAIESMTATKKTDEDDSSGTTVSSGADTVTISDAAKKLAEILANARGQSGSGGNQTGSESESSDGESSEEGEGAEGAGGSGGSGSSDSASQLEDLKKKVEELQGKILQVEQQDIPDGTKKPIVAALQAEIASIQQQIAQIQAEAAKSA
ncbi:hypothetical protein ASZ90_001173 [hydrocarbon metagenome]|uniref:FlxA-like protein n=1 Tax=hydrocarbon metagenome TaxID=938273 RepID=A0A0W8G6Z8_9ZZZZ